MSELLEMDPARFLGRAIERTTSAGEALRAAGDEALVDAVARAAAMLGDAEHALGRELCEVMPGRAALSPQNVELCLGDTLSTLRPTTLQRALDNMRRAHPGPGRTLTSPRAAAYVMSGNVFTSALRPLAWAMLCRVPVVVKVSSRGEGVAEFFARALREANPSLEHAITVVRTGRDADVIATLAARLDTLEIWGSDATIRMMRDLVPATTTFVPHGHGLGVAYVPAAALTDEARAKEVFERLSLDIARYDQRGCLSPGAVYVEPGGALSPREFARALSEQGLASISSTLPRAALSMQDAAAQMQWRGVAIARGELFEGSTWAVSFEPSGLRPSPGHRNIAVHECAGIDSLIGEVVPLGAHLKALGVAADARTRASVAAALPAPLCPRVSDLGQMQTPGLEASADGAPPWSGLVRVRDVD